MFPDNKNIHDILLREKISCTPFISQEQYYRGSPDSFMEANFFRLFRMDIKKTPLLSRGAFFCGCQDSNLEHSDDRPPCQAGSRAQARSLEKAPEPSPFAWELKF